jgi:hypothetical protein
LIAPSFNRAVLSLELLLDILGYSKSASFRTKAAQFEPEAVQLFRFAKEKAHRDDRFRVKGFYVLRTTGLLDATLAARPAVCVAEANTADDAKKLHRRIWNLGNVPFLLVRLPQEVRIYAGFRYNHSEDHPILAERSSDRAGLEKAFSDFSAESIDSARIWQAQRQHLQTKHRVDYHLLENLKHLAQALSRCCAPQLDLALAHALIGKFVYLRYLRDRNILDDAWLAKRRIELANVFGPGATVSELSRLTDALENRFRGEVFPIDFGPACPLTNSHIQLVASVFAGDDIQLTATGIAQQLHLQFQAYDFRHIPVETLSSIYEQFLHGQEKGKSDGAYYTPEVLADYLLSEIDSVRPLQPGMTVFDPACGSGIFLVLAYRRLIELELAASKNGAGNLDPGHLKRILLQSIFGVERQLDACNVTTFSLLLTLLNYVEPPALHANESFRFPVLLNNQIFCDDFFNPKLSLREPKNGFDIVIGNPPWIELKPGTSGEGPARTWIASEKTIAGNRVADAFAVKAGRLLSSNGIAGLLLPATTLFNLEGKTFRQHFFTEFVVARITNLANLRGNLFGRRAMLPTTTLVFGKPNGTPRSNPIIHHGPFATNQVAGSASQLWVLTIHGSEIQPISQRDAMTGETTVWKLALWGTPRDGRALDRLREIYPLTLARFCEKQGWGKKMPRQGAELRRRDSEEATLYCQELKGKKKFDSEKFNKVVKGGLRFTLPRQARVNIPDDECYVRERGGLGGLAINKPPHLLISATWKNFLLFDDDYLAVPARQMAIAASEVSANYLRALTVYLGTSLVDYFLFFQVPEWGVYSTFPHVALRAVRDIPTPDINEAQRTALANIHRQVLREERAADEEFFDFEVEDSSSSIKKQRLLDDRVFEVLDVPDDLRLLVEDFRDNRLPLDNGLSALRNLGRRPNKRDLLSYGRTLRDEVSRFLLGEAYPSVWLVDADDLIWCRLEFRAAGTNASQTVQVVPLYGNSARRRDLRLLREHLTERFSQWAYVDRSLRIFEEDSVHLFKSPRRMDWTRTQALNDADAIIAEILARSESVA